MSRILIAGTAAALAAAVLSLGGVLRSTSAAAPERPHAVASVLAGGFAAGDTTALVTQLQNAVRREPRLLALATRRAA